MTLEDLKKAQAILDKAPPPVIGVAMSPRYAARLSTTNRAMRYGVPLLIDPRMRAYEVFYRLDAWEARVMEQKEWDAARCQGLFDSSTTSNALLP